MGVSNIQFWADLMDVSTVPSIQLDIAQLQAGFLQYSADVSDARQTLGDEIDASDAKAEAAGVGAEEARGIAVALLSRITQSETATQAYTNAAVATLAQSLTDQLQTTKTAIQTAILTAVQGDVSAITPNLEAALNSALGSIQAEQTALGNLLTDFNSTTDAIFDDVLPKIQLLQNNVEVQVQEISEKFELFLTGSADTTLITMLDNVRIQTAEGFVQAIKEYILTVQMTFYAAGFLPSTFVGGIDNWTRSRTGSPALVDSPVGATIVQDPDLGTAMEVTLDDSGVSSNILHKGVLHVSPGKVYRTQVKFKLYGASGSINLASILQLMDENYVSLFTGSYDSVTYAVSTNDVVTVSRTFCANAGDGLTAVTELAIARYMRFGLRRVSAAGSGSATIRIGEITLEDLSDVYDLKANVTQLQSATTSNAGAIASLGTSLTAAIDDVAADVVINANALTTLNGNAAASYALRVGAGGASAGMEIVAANNPISGPASAIRLSAKHIEVLASSMRISDSGNVFPDFDMLDPLFYSSTTAAIYNFVPTTSVPLGAKWLNVGANAALKTVETNWFPIEPSTEYLVAGAAWASSAVAGTGTSTVSFETGALNGSGAITVIESTAVKTTTDATYNSPSSFGEVSVLTASGARRGRFVVTRAAGGTGAVCAGAFKVQKKAGASLIVDGSLEARHITTDGLDASVIKSGKIETRLLEITELLRIDSGTGAFSVGKDSAFDLANDGAYFGRTLGGGGIYGFGFAAGQKVGGVDQYIQATDQTGLKLVNAAHFVTGAIAVSPVNITTSQTVTLPVGCTSISLNLIGGGKGGSGSVTPGGNGGNTTVELWDGATNTGVSWVSNGATAAMPTPTAESSPIGVAGTAGYHNGSGTMVPAGNATGYGAGGGGSGGRSHKRDEWSSIAPGFGGKAAPYVQVEGYDISSLTNPKLVIVIGEAGVKAASNCGNGSPGFVQYTPQTTSMVPASVLPMHPSYTGTITKAAGAALVFPDYGAGLWCLSTASANLWLDLIQTHASGKQVRLTYGGYASFISDITPVDVATSTLAITYEYQFYKLGTWV